MIEIRLFKFDSKTDYLPYYKSYTLKQKNLTTLNELLDAIYNIEKFSYIKDEPFFLKVNGIFTSSDALLSEFASNEFVIEPISIKRALNDLIIDTKDYQKKLEVLAPYITDMKEIIKEKTYMLEYYASNTQHFKEDYIGEHVILLAADIVSELPMLEKEISELIHGENGIQHRSSLKYRVLSTLEDENISSVVAPNIIQSFENFNIALYCALRAPSFKTVIEKSNAHYIDLESKHFDIPKKSKKLSYLMAGTILLEAMDNNADFLIVNNSDDLKLFDAKQKEIEKTMGREIGLPVLTQNEFLQLLQGNKNISSHKIKVSFLD